MQISLLSLFCDLLYKFPNMVVAAITRESVREAFKMGISASQVIDNFILKLLIILYQSVLYIK